MQKMIQDDYIVAFLKDGDDDVEYEKTKNIFNNVEAPGKNQIWRMKVDGTMVLVDLPQSDVEIVDDDDAVLELAELMGVV